MACPLAFEMPCFSYKNSKLQLPKKSQNDLLNFLEFQSQYILLGFQMVHLRGGFRNSTSWDGFWRISNLKFSCKQIGPFRKWWTEIKKFLVPLFSYFIVHIKITPYFKMIQICMCVFSSKRIYFFSWKSKFFLQA